MISVGGKALAPLWFLIESLHLSFLSALLSGDALTKNFLKPVMPTVARASSCSSLIPARVRKV